MSGVEVVDCELDEEELLEARTSSVVEGGSGSHASVAG